MTKAEFCRLTKEFRAYYERVDEVFAGFMEALATDERAWLQTVSKEFQAKFMEWMSNTDVQDYLAAASKHGRVVRLAALVFLHICYDLPQVLAANLSGKSAAEIQTFRLAYLRADWVIRKAFGACLNDRRVVGWWWWLVSKLQYWFPGLVGLGLAGLEDSVLLKRWLAWENGIEILETPCIIHAFRTFIAVTAPELIKRCGLLPNPILDSRYGPLLARLSDQWNRAMSVRDYHIWRERPERPPLEDVDVND